jgi:predicted RNA-binding protein with PIN domain
MLPFISMNGVLTDQDLRVCDDRHVRPWGHRLSRVARWLVDGMNVIGSKPDRWWNDIDRAVHRMVDSLRGFAERTGEDVTVVFDRKPRDLEPGRHGPILVEFARWRGRNAADHEIVRIVAEDPDPSGVTVVTSDDRLAERVEELGAKVAPAGGFRRRLDDATA